MAKLVNIILMLLWSSTAQCSCSFFNDLLQKYVQIFVLQGTLHTARLVWLLWWLVGTKHFPESMKTLPRIQKHVSDSKNTSQNPKHVPESINTSQDPKTHPRIQKHFQESKTRAKSISKNPKYFCYRLFCIS